MTPSDRPASHSGVTLSAMLSQGDCALGNTTQPARMGVGVQPLALPSVGTTPLALGGATAWPPAASRSLCRRPAPGVARGPAAGLAGLWEGSPSALPPDLHNRDLHCREPLGQKRVIYIAFKNATNRQRENNEDSFLFF